MALEGIDTSREHRGPVDLERLVRAIWSGGEFDENHWIEWKSTLDLSSTKGKATLAKAILGMANRQPDEAALVCRGLGYVIVGAGPGKNDQEFIPIDPSDLDQGLQQFLGATDIAPQHAFEYLRIDGSDVLVVTVEAPRDGEPPFVFRRQSDGVADGAIFVRKKGRTIPAGSGEFDALMKRSRRGGPQLDLSVDLTGDVPIPWIRVSDARRAVQAWADEKRSIRTRLARAEQDRRDFKAARQSGGRDIFDVVMESSVPDFLVTSTALQDQRTPEEFVAEVDAWAADLKNVTFKQMLPYLLLESGHGEISVRVANNGDDHLSKVKVRLHFPSEPWILLEDPMNEPPLPPPPLPFGKAFSYDSVGRIQRDYERVLGNGNYRALRPDFGSQSIEVDDQSITFRTRELAPQDREISDRVFLILDERPDGGVLRIDWTATAKEARGVHPGSIEVPIASEPIDVASLLQAVDESLDL